MSAANDNGFKIAYSPVEAAEATGVSRATIFNLLRDGKLKRVKIGTKTVIPRSSLEALFDPGVDAA